MGTVGMLARCEIRRRWRSTVALALLLGAVGAVILATAAGARRSDAALDRFKADSRTSDVEISIGFPTAAELRQFRTTPGIAAMALAHGYSLVVNNNEGTVVAVPVDSAFGDVVDRSRLIKGRFANQATADEATIGERLAADLHLTIGSELPAASYTAAQIKTAFSGGNPGDPAGPRIVLHVVGIVRRPLDLGVRAASGGIVLLPLGFNAKYGSSVGLYTDTVRVKTRRGTADVPQVVAAARKLWGDAQTFQVQPLGIENEGAHSAIDVLTSALWIFAAVTAFAGAVAVGIVLTRDVADVAVDQSTLRELGVTRVQRMLALGARTGLVAGGGALLAVVGAILASPIFPLGLARRADPDIGFHADLRVLAAGVAVLTIAVLAIAFVAAWRATRAPSADREARARRTSVIVETAARAGLPPPATNGLRMALQAGRGAQSVPIRSGHAGAIIGTAGITAVLVFAASLAHLVDTPRLAGWTWDLKTAVGDHPGAHCVDRDDHGLLRIPGVAALAASCTRTIEIDGHPISGWGFESLRGTIEPEIVDGRAPNAPNEIVLGSVTRRALHKDIGDTVKVHGQGGDGVYTIVGQVVLPTISSEDLQPLADGAAFTIEGIRKVADEGPNQTHFLLVRFAPGANTAAIARAMKAIPQSKDFGGPTTPAVEVERLQQIDSFPAILAVLLTILALVAVGHTLITSVRRRRRELALLKTIGFGRRQLSSTIAWQATTLVAVGVVVGIPVGILIGRVVWRSVANGLGIADTPTIPPLALALMAVGALVLVNVLAYIPARSAARTRAAVALRAE